MSNGIKDYSLRYEPLATFRAIQPCVSNRNLTGGAAIIRGHLSVMLFDHHEGYDSNQIRHQDDPPGRWYVKEIAEHTVPATKRI